MNKKQESPVVNEVGNQEDAESAAGEEATIVHQDVLLEGLAHRQRNWEDSNQMWSGTLVNLEQMSRKL